MSRVEYIIGSSEESLAGLPDRSVHFSCCSPPYWQLRRYGGGDGQHGMEPTVGEYIAQQMVVFDQMMRVLRDDGALVVNLGSTYVGGHGGKGGPKQQTNPGSGIDTPDKDETEYVLRDDLTQAELAFVLRELAECSSL